MHGKHGLYKHHTICETDFDMTNYGLERERNKRIITSSSPRSEDMDLKFDEFFESPATFGGELKPL